MIISHFYILNFVYNYIEKNKPGSLFGYMCLILNPSPITDTLNTLGRNNCNIIIS